MYQVVHVNNQFVHTADSRSRAPTRGNYDGLDRRYYASFIDHRGFGRQWYGGAQDAANSAAPTLEEIVITGSALRGVAPVGSNLVTVGRDEIENTGAQTVQQILKTVPSVVGLQSAGQAAYGSFDGAGTNAPTIHGLGASASNSTLILLNGHRMPVSGINHVLADPNIVAPLALERVEVLADGASSVYGSDAVAGVVNFITRRNVDGVEASLQTGVADAYGTVNAGVLAGTTWDSGSLLVSYNYSDRDNLEAVDRDYVRANQTARGGRDFTPNRCGPASITVCRANLLHAVHELRAPSPAIAILRFTPISWAVKLVTAYSRRSKRTSAIG